MPADHTPVFPMAGYPLPQGQSWGEKQVTVMTQSQAVGGGPRVLQVAVTERERQSGALADRQLPSLIRGQEAVL